MVASFSLGLLEASALLFIVGLGSPVYGHYRWLYALKPAAVGRNRAYERRTPYENTAHAQHRSHAPVCEILLRAASGRSNGLGEERTLVALPIGLT
jgi:hypothetical protein